MPKQRRFMEITQFVSGLKIIDDFAIEDVSLSSRGEGYLLSFTTKEYCEDTIRNAMEESFEKSTMVVNIAEYSFNKTRIKVEIFIKGV